MCLSPVLILKRNPRYDSKVSPCALPFHSRMRGYLLLNDIKQRNQIDFRKPGFKFDYNNFVDNCLYSRALVPCGKCSQCLGKRQSDLAARCALEARKRGSMCFLTLTYDNNSLPISVLLQKVDCDTGEVFEGFSLHMLPRPELCRSKKDKASFGKIKPPIPEHVDCLRGFGNLSSRRVKEYEKDLIYSPSENCVYRYHFTPSLCTRDVRLWLKRARMSYEREYGEKLPEFTYVVCGEYGSSTHRPHYHLGFFGLQKKHVDYLASLWPYGFSYIQQVNCVNEDGSDGFAAASKYIGKYMSKGEFECPSVTCGYAVKGRLASSRGLGGVLPPALVSYYRGYDLLGEYDINKPLSNDTVKKLVELLRQRACLTVGKSVFVLPGKFIRQIWYIQRSDKTFSASVVRKQICLTLQRDVANDLLEQFRECFPEAPTDSLFEMVSSELEVQRVSQEIKDTAGKLRYQKFYLTSKF